MQALLGLGNQFGSGHAQRPREAEQGCKRRLALATFQQGIYTGTVALVKRGSKWYRLR